MVTFRIMRRVPHPAAMSHMWLEVVDGVEARDLSHALAAVKRMGIPGTFLVVKDGEWASTEVTVPDERELKVA